MALRISHRAMFDKDQTSMTRDLEDVWETNPSSLSGGLNAIGTTIRTRTREVVRLVLKAAGVDTDGYA